MNKEKEMNQKGFGNNNQIRLNISTKKELKEAFFKSCKKYYLDELGLGDWKLRAYRRWKMTGPKDLVKKYLIEIFRRNKNLSFYY